MESSDLKVDVLERNNGLDLLRVFSSIAVVLIHVNARWLFTAQVSELANNYVFAEIINLLTRFCVPCFVMISGAFLLDNKSNANFIDFYKKSFIKLGIPYTGIALFWISISFLKDVIIKHEVGTFIKIVVVGTYGNLWFMPMLFGLYLLVPIIIRIRNELSEKNFVFFSVILLIWGVISQASTEYTLPYSLGVVMSYVGYFAMGLCLYKCKLSVRIKKIGVGLICLLLTIAIVLRVNGFSFYTEDPYRSFFSPAVLIYSCGVFVFFRDLKINFNLKYIADLTYYIYLLHGIVLILLFKFLALYKMGYVMGILCAMLLTVTFTILASLVYKKFCESIVKKCWK